LHKGREGPRHPARWWQTTILPPYFAPINLVVKVSFRIFESAITFDMDMSDDVIYDDLFPSLKWNFTGTYLGEGYDGFLYLLHSPTSGLNEFAWRVNDPSGDYTSVRETWDTKQQFRPSFNNFNAAVIEIHRSALWTAVDAIEVRMKEWHT